MKPPFSADEQARLAALERYRVLDTEPERAFDDLTLLAAHLCGTPVALVSLIDRDRQWFKSKVGLEVEETPRELAFCAHAIVGDGMLVVPDATRDPRFADNPLVTGDPKIRFYAGTPLVTPEGYGLGTLCVIDMVPRDLDPEQHSALAALGRQVVSQLELRRKIRDLEETQTELRKARREAVEASAAKSAFLANMTHELRTPLNAIIGYSELLEEEASDAGHESLTGDLEKIRRAGRHLLELINDVLDISKIEAGRIELCVEPVDLVALVEDVVSAAAPLAEANGNRLLTRGATRGASHLGDAVTDATKVRQILYNLISNAAKFTRGGTIELVMSVDSESAGEWIVWEVADTGIGMTPAQLDSAFEAFRQADASTTREYGGTGLGLAISRRLATALGGTLEAESTPGEGSVFTLRVPRRLTATSPTSAG